MALKEDRFYPPTEVIYIVAKQQVTGMRASYESADVLYDVVRLGGQTYYLENNKRVTEPNWIHRKVEAKFFGASDLAKLAARIEDAGEQPSGVT